MTATYLRCACGHQRTPRRLRPTARAATLIPKEN